MKQGGVVIGVMADSLLKAATSSKWRKGLMDGHTVLVSPFYPEAGFSAGNAMARNKYIYCLADTSLVVHSGKKGGTLNGAEENLKKAWVPLWVKHTTDKDAANADLVAKGGYWLDADAQTLTIADLMKNEGGRANQVKEMQVDLFSSMPAQPELFAESMFALETEATEAERKVASIEEKIINTMPSETVVEINEQLSSSVDFYHLFITELHRLASTPIAVDDLIGLTGLHKLQLNDWLKRAESDGVVKKLNRPVRYQLQEKS
jgi:predicted Rossmann fold nucleotide-binding protein DprA/Smf involved in DNA uptake